MAEQQKSINDVLGETVFFCGRGNRCVRKGNNDHYSSVYKDDFVKICPQCGEDYAGLYSGNDLGEDGEFDVYRQANINQHNFVHSHYKGPNSGMDHAPNSYPRAAFTICPINWCQDCYAIHLAEIHSDDISPGQAYGSDLDDNDGNPNKYHKRNQSRKAEGAAAKSKKKKRRTSKQKNKITKYMGPKPGPPGGDGSGQGGQGEGSGGPGAGAAPGIVAGGSKKSKRRRKRRKRRKSKKFRKRRKSRRKTRKRRRRRKN